MKLTYTHLHTLELALTKWAHMNSLNTLELAGTHQNSLEVA